MRTVALFACLIGCLSTGVALADRPLATETADVIERGSCQAEFTFGRTRQNGQSALRDVSAQYTCGAVFQTQPVLAYTASYGGAQFSEGVWLGAKTNFVVPADGRFGLGVAYSTSGFKAPGAVMKFDETRVSALLSTEMTHALLLHANLGVAHSRLAQQSSTLWSLGLETTGRVTLAGDVFGDNRTKPSVSAGLGFTLAKGASFNAVYALHLEPPRTRQFSLGAKFEF